MGRPADLPSLAHFQAMPCGTRAKYVGAKCRCMLCRAANSRYNTDRAKAIKAGEGNPLVPAKAARQHLLRLSKQGIGKRAVYAACDVGLTIITKVRSGQQTQIRRQTERRILGVTAEAISDHAIVSAKQTQQRIATLLHEGFTKTELARRLGSVAKTPALQLKSDRIISANAVKVERLFTIVMAGA